MKIANLFTAARIALMVPLFWLLLQGPGWLALALFLLAGVTDIADGYLARKLNQASKFGAFFDLLADRILTLVVGIGLIVPRPHNLPLIIAVMVLIARNSVVAGLNEALPGKLDIMVSWLEKIKIAFNFLGFALLMIPGGRTADWDNIGTLCLCVSAILCLATLIDYSTRASRAFRISE